MSNRLLIRGGRVLDPGLGIDEARDVLIRDGRIEALEHGLAGRSALKNVPSLDAREKWVVPGLIDMHVHLREPGGEPDETIATGTRAAAAGGFTTVLAMPNTRPPMDDPALLRRLRARAARCAPINVLFAAAVTRGQDGRRLTDFDGLQEAGAAAFSDDGRPVADERLMRRALERSRRLRVPVIAHCEHPPGNVSAAGETAMARRDLALAAEVRGRLHLAHISAAGTVRALRRAKGMSGATGEATPHHWTLCASDIPDRDPDYKMNPPLRSRADRDAIRKALAEGVIDAVASDHAPHSPEKKALGFTKAPFGVIGLETALALALTRLAGKVLSPLALIERMSTAPARILGLDRKGSLAPGADADVTIIDPRAAWTVKLPFVSKCRNSPFLGMRLKGRARTVIVGGRIVHAL